jgi:hypothetical protein
MARLFDGSGDYAVIGADAAWNGNEVSVGFWCKIPTGHGNVQFDRIIECDGYDDGTVPAQGWGIEVATAGATKVGLRLWGAAQGYPVGTDYTYSLDTWFHIGITSRSSSPSSSFFINGTRQGSANTTDTRNTNSPTITLAARDGDPTQNQSSCRIAHLCIYAGIWTDPVMASLGAGMSPVFLASAGLLEEYWPLFGYDSPEPALKSSRTVTITNASQDLNGPVLFSPYGLNVNRPAGAAGGSSIRRRNQVLVF